MDSEVAGKSFLLNTVQLQRTNNETIVELFQASMNLLWPNGVLRDKVFLFISDAAPYMMKAGKALKTFYPRMLHVSCIVHALHRVAEKIRDIYKLTDRFIALMKVIFLKSPSRVAKFEELYPDLPLPPKPVIVRWGTWLTAASYYAENYQAVKTVVEALEDEDTKAITGVKKIFNKKEGDLIMQLTSIQQSYMCIVAAIDRLQKNGMPLVESFKILNDVTDKLSTAPDSEVTLKLAQTLSKNSDLRFLRALANKDAVSFQFCKQFENMSPLELAKFSFAPVVSCEVERSFSIFKSILRDNRRSFKIENLKKHLIVACFCQ